MKWHAFCTRDKNSFASVIKIMAFVREYTEMSA